MTDTRDTDYLRLADKALCGEELTYEESSGLLDAGAGDLLPLLQAAFKIRRTYWGTEVRVHILNNVQNGLCSEDCSYCPQSGGSQAPIAEYPMKSEGEVLAEADRAWRAGAFRYCMVFSGKAPDLARTRRIAGYVEKIKAKYPLEVCVSAGIFGEEHLALLKDSGCDRINHNLNTSERNYPLICTTHTYRDRLNTLLAAGKAGLEVCSGLIAGLGETRDELIELALTFRRLDVKSIPVNFLLPIEGNKAAAAGLDPQYCLKILCLFRFLNPRAEIRVAAGRELNLRSLEVMSLYPANSLFLDGYLNVKGSPGPRTLEMIRDAGFTIASEFRLEDILDGGKKAPPLGRESLKTGRDLRPAL
ncbi:MAG: biotin synthase BioB [Elusimicrobia bacterium]|nr:biotin synthase BioB [Elusimicrobiota bacterium]